MTLVRDLVKGRINYHLERGVRDGALPKNMPVVPVLEQEVLEEGYDLPAVLIKESSTPNPSVETIGHDGTMWQDVFDGKGRRELIHGTNVRIDLLVLTASPDERAFLESYLHGVCLADLDYYLAAGLEGVEVQRNGRHDVDPAGHHYYSVELTLTGTWSIRVIEELATATAP